LAETATIRFRFLRLAADSHADISWLLLSLRHAILTFSSPLPPQIPLAGHFEIRHYITAISAAAAIVRLPAIIGRH